MAREEIHGLVKFVLFALDGQRKFQIKNNYFGLKLCYLHPRIAKAFTNFTSPEIMNYSIK